jgi:hypothetical protein
VGVWALATNALATDTDKNNECFMFFGGQRPEEKALEE